MYVCESISHWKCVIISISCIFVPNLNKSDATNFTFKDIANYVLKQNLLNLTEVLELSSLNSLYLMLDLDLAIKTSSFLS